MFLSFRVSRKKKRMVRFKGNVELNALKMKVTSGLGAGFPIQGSRVQNHWVAPRSIKSVPGISGNLVVKSKLPPRSCSSLEAVEPHP